MGRKLRGRRQPKKTALGKPETLTLTIDQLGAQGDGIAVWQGKSLFISGAVPGETLRAAYRPSRGQQRAELLEVLESSSDRVVPPCPHFGPCGGCNLQHLGPEPYRDWKRQLLVTALKRRGFASTDDLVAPLVIVPAGSRRRVTWAAQKRGGQVTLGFYGERSHSLVGLQRCLLLVPALEALLASLPAVLERLLRDGQKASVHASESEAGVAMLLSLPEALNLAARETLAAFAERADLAHLSVSLAGEAPEPLAARRHPWVSFAGLRVSLPEAAFLQPSTEGETWLQEAVLQAVPVGVEQVADLFSGLGTFTLPLVKRGHRLLAVESDAVALSSLQAAARSAGLGDRVTIEQRDLDRQPLQASDLKLFDALIFDPPRAGAAAQAELLAEAGPPAVVAVSCNPASFARDAATLCAGGYDLRRVQPLDQFPWSHHLELVALFAR
ncbi:MAG: 23S rRNA (uracil(1939)-C(5))-methyltransferase RlmD [Pseudomonadota bacterium]